MCISGSGYFFFSSSRLCERLLSSSNENTVLRIWTARSMIDVDLSRIGIDGRIQRAFTCDKIIRDLKLLVLRFSLNNNLLVSFSLSSFFPNTPKVHTNSRISNFILFFSASARIFSLANYARRLLLPFSWLNYSQLIFAPPWVLNEVDESGLLPSFSSSKLTYDRKRLLRFRKLIRKKLILVDTVGDSQEEHFQFMPSIKNWSRRIDLL